MNIDVWGRGIQMIFDRIRRRTRGGVRGRSDQAVVVKHPIDDRL